MTEYAGLCVGGPMAGKSAVSRTTVLRVEERPVATLRDKLEASVSDGPMPDLEVTTHTYHWLHMGGYALWIIDTLNAHDAIKEMAVAYAEKHSGQA